MLQNSTEELIERLSGSFILVFDDGELVTNYKETIYSSFIWDYHRLATQLFAEKVRLPRVK
jgi:hypothetical protein